MLGSTYYAQNYASIMWTALPYIQPLFPKWWSHTNPLEELNIPRPSPWSSFCISTYICSYTVCKGMAGRSSHMNDIMSRKMGEIPEQKRTLHAPVCYFNTGFKYIQGYSPSTDSATSRSFGFLCSLSTYICRQSSCDELSRAFLLHCNKPKLQMGKP